VVTGAIPSGLGVLKGRSTVLAGISVNTIKKGLIEKFLGRMKSQDSEITGPELDDVLKEILIKANEFVPSEAGSILLDDPQVKSEAPGDPSCNSLYFVACYGPSSNALLGTSITATTGVAGKTYISGKPYISSDAHDDDNFYGDIDIQLNMETRSILCVPIVIGSSICGVIELLNKKPEGNYEESDLKLLEIFAGYTSTLIQNSLDAKRNQELTRRDDLTGLFNDRYFHQALTEELKVAQMEEADVSLLFIDLDNFKTVNDTLGHLAGSRTLAEVGHLLKDTLEDEKAIAIRYGGDEFAIILPGKNRIEAALIADKVRLAIQHQVFLSKPSEDGEEAYNIHGIITCSIGVSSYREDEITGNTLLQNKIDFIRKADRSMYKAKQNGKNCIFMGDRIGLYEPGISPRKPKRGSAEAASTKKPLSPRNR